MNVLVINGSPRTDNSLTLQTVLFLQKKFCDDKFTFLNLATHLNALEIDFDECAKMIYDADLLLFSYPVYFGSVTSHLYRFIELLKANRLFLGAKFFTQITSSQKYMDFTAHAFIQQNCQDLKMKCIKGFSSFSDSILKEEGQKQALEFFNFVKYSVQNGIYESSVTLQKNYCGVKVFVPYKQVDRLPGKICLLTDCSSTDIQLRSMIDRFRSQSQYSVEVYNLNEQDIKGGCKGCLKCTKNSRCVYKDGFLELYKNLSISNAVVLAFTIKNHSIPYQIKKYIDRQFVFGFRNLTRGLPAAFLVAGPLDDEPYLKIWLTSHADSQGLNLMGIATDQRTPDFEIDTIVKKMTYSIQNRYQESRNFFQTAGEKIYRDYIFLNKGFFPADHKYFKKNKIYDFADRHLFKSIKTSLKSFFVHLPLLKKKLLPRLSENILKPYKKLLDRLDEEKSLADQKEAIEITRGLLAKDENFTGLEKAEKESPVASGTEKESESQQNGQMETSQEADLEERMPSDDFFKNLS